ncbi:fungal-specific transcription factor domain-containing protein [Lipomyces chichibuensis]|uniref:fungal-specific transcription factor domain-containing protein n=1 Tax=Lipomyces chichibuensis TaxID=1546026 RepID=UPI003343A1D6
MYVASPQYIMTGSPNDSEGELSANASANYPWLLRTHPPHEPRRSQPHFPSSSSSTKSYASSPYSAPLSPASSIATPPSCPSQNPSSYKYYSYSTSAPHNLTAIPRSVTAYYPASPLLSPLFSPRSTSSARAQSFDMPSIEHDISRTLVSGTRRKSSSGSSSSTDGRNIRRRITRACDQCNQLRTKCDGKQPCLHCLEFSLQCDYVRERKKRGKASKRELAQQAVTDAVAASTGQESNQSTHQNHDHELMEDVPSAQNTHDQIITFDSPTFDMTSNGLSSFLAGTDESAHQLSVSMSRVSHASQSIEASVQLQQPQSMPLPSPLPAPEWYPQDLSEFSISGPRTNTMLQTTPSGVQYPILNEILPQLLTFMPPALPSDLLETYFSPNIYSLAPLLRKSSILSTVSPRPCSASLLYSILLSAAYRSDNPHLTSSPSARLDIIHNLFDLCLSSLRPLLHSTEHGTLDDVITYVHLGTVASASEFKGSSLRWWNAAWVLARELNLNIEHPDLDDEDREEMRRTWWLLFIVDRHLGLCYNRPLAILDAHCMRLHYPLTTDEEWASDAMLIPAELIPDAATKLGVQYAITGTDIFGFFLPLMAILGGIVELHHLEQHPAMHLGTTSREIRGHLSTCLDIYERSLNAYDDQGVWRFYATHLAHVLRILLAGYCDPLDMLLASESLLATNEFMTCATHGLRAADAVKRILELDPELIFMPFFFAVYLLHGGFVWLMFVDKIESYVADEVRDACETVVRAHEVCVVRLNTEYQRNLRRVMRGALVGMQKDVEAPEREESRRQRKETLQLYRWCAGGNGLAV